MDNGIMIKAGIVGGAGYTGGELIRLLLNHPQVDLVFAQSKSQAGKPVYSVHQDLIGETGLLFSDAATEEVDVIFLCAGHGAAQEFLTGAAVSLSTKIIDLSQDFRWQEDTEAGAVEAHDRAFVYGLPELQREEIKEAASIANPGCFATAIQLALLPLADQNLLTSEVHVSGITGSTGAGQSLSPTSHFSWRNGNVSNYKVLEHQHLNEIRRTLSSLQEKELPPIHFVPYRGPFTRGILCTAYLNFDLELAEALQLYKSYFRSHPFITITDTTPDLKQVINTNKCLLHLTMQGNQLIITSVIDNLLKGASGQALQNMNLMYGLGETTGLKLKASAF
ncbi:N-acetyl-gamma-glutamyl-phosphate reductase [Pontibacter sp. MBLB2868]|uniref:N-acetyl-gamma-glutamyl-phosphate reductase n=1 Tax=Pontibacter sp. MBLB2868 TaxID=3451555 RepID=UPI003F75326D